VQRQGELARRDGVRAREAVPAWVGRLSEDGEGHVQLRVTGDSARWVAVSLAVLDVDLALVEASDAVAAHLDRLGQRLRGLAPA